MQITHLQAFVTIYETRSFAKTAAQLYLSQSAVSQQLKRIEQELGYALFTRNKHEVCPTSAGDTFYPYARHIVRLMGEAEEALAQCGSGFSMHFVDRDVHDPLHSALFRLSSAHPDVSVNIFPPLRSDAFTNADALDEGHLYLVRKAWIVDRRIHFAQLGEARFACVLSPTDPLFQRESLSASDIRERRVLLTRVSLVTPGPYMGEILRHLKAHLSMEQIEFEANAALIAAKVLKEPGRYITVLPAYVTMPEQDRLARLPFIEVGASPLGFAYIGTLSPVMKRFISFSREAFL